MDPNDRDERHVVLEDQQTPQPRLKQYILLKEMPHSKKLKRHKIHDLVRLTNDEALPLVSAGIVVPIDTAIKLGVYPPKKESLVDKLKEATKTAEEKPLVEELKAETSDTKTTEKSFLQNKLREAILKKKTESKSETGSLESAQISAAKLEAIKSGGKK